MSDTKNTTGSKSFAPPIGFRFGAVAAGVKEAGGARKDLALIASEIPCAAAGVLTVNKMRAAPVTSTTTMPEPVRSPDFPMGPEHSTDTSVPEGESAIVNVTSFAPASG